MLVWAGPPLPPPPGWRVGRGRGVVWFEKLYKIASFSSVHSCKMRPSKRKAIVCLKHMEVMRGNSHELSIHARTHRNKCCFHHLSILVCHSCDILVFQSTSASENQVFYSAHSHCASNWISFDRNELCNKVKLNGKWSMWHVVSMWNIPIVLHFQWNLIFRHSSHLVHWKDMALQQLLRIW